MLLIGNYPLVKKWIKLYQLIIMLALMVSVDYSFAVNCRSISQKIYPINIDQFKLRFKKLLENKQYHDAKHNITMKIGPISNKSTNSVFLFNLALSKAKYKNYTDINNIVIGYGTNLFLLEHPDNSAVLINNKIYGFSKYGLAIYTILNNKVYKSYYWRSNQKVIALQCYFENRKLVTEYSFSRT